MAEIFLQYYDGLLVKLCIKTKTNSYYIRYRGDILIPVQHKTITGADGLRNKNNFHRIWNLS
jgi:hypothetical protein